MTQIQVTRATSEKPLPSTSTLGFGQYFSDHIFLVNYSESQGWHSPRVAPYGPISIDPGASVFHYGQALFEGMKAFKNIRGETVIFRPEYNYNRLLQGAERLCMQVPPMATFMEGLRTLLKVDERWIPKDDGCSLYIRPTLIGSEAFLGVRPSKEYIFYILLSPVGSYYAEGSKPIRIWVETKYLRAAPGGLGATKAGANYAASLKAAYEAKARGYAQVLWLDFHREAIEEVGTMNVFFVFKDEVVTPVLNGSILAGGVRDSVIQLLKAQGTLVTERKVTIQEIAERLSKGELLESFGTGTAAVISPIGELNYEGKPLIINSGEAGPVSKKLLLDLQSIQRGTSPDKFGWITKI